MSKKYIKCPYCEAKYIRKDLIRHIDRKHADLLPEDYTATRLVFDKVNNNTVGHGTCRICGRPTEWSESKGMYNVICGRKQCKDALRKQYENNMLRVKGTTNLLNDPVHQKKMLDARHISGTYTFNDGGTINYMGSYERKFLEFVDNFMEIGSTDLVPAPVLQYQYQGETHQYYPDFYYVPYNLIIEIKDGGEHPNTLNSPGLVDSRARMLAKEKIFTEKGEYNYIRLTDNQFVQFVEVLMDMKYKIMVNDKTKTISINNFVGNSIWFDESTLLESGLPLYRRVNVINELSAIDAIRIKQGKYYRFTYNGEGIYEAYKKMCTPQEWQVFLNSNAAKWLPKPPEYKVNYYSYFTAEGACYFIINTLTPMISQGKLYKPNIIFTEYDEIPKSKIVYEDKYQIVTKVPAQLDESTILREGIFDKRFITESVMNKEAANILTFERLPKDVKLYHGSPKQGLKYLEPRSENIADDTGNQDLVFATPYKQKAACFGGEWNDGIARQWSVDGVFYFAPTDKVNMNKPCSLYEVENDGNWYILPNHSSEVVHKSAVKILKETRYSSFKSMLGLNAVSVVDMDTYNKMHSSTSYSRALIKSQYLEKGDKCYNLDKLDPKRSNILYITGVSGGGKTTLAIDMAKELNCDRVELDYVSAYYMRKVKDIGKQQKMYDLLKKDCPLAVQFLEDNQPEIVYPLYEKFGDTMPVVKAFLAWFIDIVSSNGKLYVVNGAHLFELPVENYYDKPLIMKDINWLKTAIRRTAREYNVDNDFIKNITDMAKAFKVTTKPGYIDANIQATKFRKNLNKYAGLVESTLLESSTLNEIIDFNNKLNTFKYGIIVNGKPRSVDDFSKYRTITIFDFAKYRTGVCWDYVNYESAWFRQNGIPHKCYFIVQNNHELSTHTFLVYEENGKYYYFESAWRNYAGVWEYNSLNEILADVVDRHLDTLKPVRKVDNTKRYWAIYEYITFGLDHHLTAEQFMKACSNGRLVATNNDKFAIVWSDFNFKRNANLFIEVEENFNESYIDNELYQHIETEVDDLCDD